MGNRIAKHIYTDNAFTLLEKSTYYVRDASGNVMAVYDRIIDASEETGEFMLSERHIYGSSRIGMDVSTHVFGPDPYTALTETTRELGRRQYEISNHLGNVLSVITDQKLPVVDATVVVSYSAVVVTATDYSPFGVGLYGRSWSGEYRYGFQGQEKDSDVSESNFAAEFWQYSSNLAWRYDPDPVVKPNESPYSTFSRSPIYLVDPTGADTTVYVVYSTVQPMGFNSTEPKLSKSELDDVKNEMQKIFELNGMDVNVKIVTAQELKNIELDLTDAVVTIRHWDWDFTESEGNSKVLPNGDIETSETITYIKTLASRSDAQAIRKRNGEMSITEIIGYKAAHEIAHQYVEMARLKMYGSEFKPKRGGHDNSQLNLLMDGDMWRDKITINPSADRIAQSKKLPPYFRDLAVNYIDSFKKDGCICKWEVFKKRIGQ
jgi:hypothetical protein